MFCGSWPAPTNLPIIGATTTVSWIEFALRCLSSTPRQGEPRAKVRLPGAGLSETTIQPQLEELHRRDLVVLNGDRIVGAYPFTDRDADHQVTLDGRVVNAMCAVDALGIGAMTDRDITIASRCRHCGAPIRVTTRDQGRALAQIEPRTAVMWQSVRYEVACAANSLCA